MESIKTLTAKSKPKNKSKPISQKYKIDDLKLPQTPFFFFVPNKDSF